jgi:endonuclease III
VSAVTRLQSAIAALQQFYGKLPTPPRDPFALFVWEVMSVHSTPRKRDLAIGALKRARALTPDAMWRLPQKKLEACAILAGPYLEQRIRALRTGVDMFRRNPKLPTVIRGPATAARKALKGMPQMGEGGAYRMLLFAADHAVLPVDSRLSRVARRLGYGEPHDDFAKAARAIRAAVTAELPPTAVAFRQAYLYLSHHGAAPCTETAPHCPICPLLRTCPTGTTKEQDGHEHEPEHEPRRAQRTQR